MNFQSHFLVIYLLLLFFSPRGVTVEKNVVWGILTKSISLDIPDFLKDQDKDDIRWFKGPTLIAKVNQNGGNHSFYLRDTIYEIFPNGTLKIKELEKNSEQNYKVSVYHKNGTNLLEKVLTLHVMEAVSKPEMTWNCTERIVICEVQRGTDAELTLFENGTQPLKMGTVKKEGMRLKYTWPKKYPPRKEFKCVAKNPVSEEWIVGQTPCTVKVWNIYHILSICGGVIILLIFLTLAISCFLRRKKQKKKPNGSWFRLYFQVSSKSDLLLEERKYDEQQRSRKMGGGFSSPVIGRG
ncbi:T-cell surface antigen CD2 isoform X2 [Phascolarctos cinereus]|uniref:T-cell surface antigen CD2 isoform X2 n=1 Tax=Phascolarctos cinereus TaxID=38626 RepID=A0A6P5LJK5_PHACI|nr:T-cell surface antigen CD2 isoform X2 [Phascolarctos cinereus]